MTARRQRLPENGGALARARHPRALMGVPPELVAGVLAHCFGARDDANYFMGLFAYRKAREMGEQALRQKKTRRRKRRARKG